MSNAVVGNEFGPGPVSSSMGISDGRDINSEAKKSEEEGLPVSQEVL